MMDPMEMAEDRTTDFVNPHRRHGGMAFPRSGFYPVTTDEMDVEAVRERMPALTTPQAGMTLRDYFAGQAIAGDAAMLCNPDQAPDMALNAYILADAMLKARQK